MSPPSCSLLVDFDGPCDGLELPGPGFSLSRDRASFSIARLPRLSLAILMSTDDVLFKLWMFGTTSIAWPVIVVADRLCFPPRFGTD